MKTRRARPRNELTYVSTGSQLRRAADEAFDQRRMVPDGGTQLSEVEIEALIGEYKTALGEVVNALKEFFGDAEVCQGHGARRHRSAAVPSPEGAAMTATSDFDRLFPEATAATRELIGQRVRRRDVPGTRGTVQRVVHNTAVMVRWDGYTVDFLEALSHLERLP